jgi:hypothetical protein
LENDINEIKRRRAELNSNTFEPLIDKYFKELYQKDVPPLWFDWEMRGGIPIANWEAQRDAIAVLYAWRIAINTKADVVETLIQAYKEIVWYLGADIRNREVYAKYYPVTETLIRGFVKIVGEEEDRVYQLLYKDTRESIRIGDLGDIKVFQDEKHMKLALLFFIITRYREYSPDTYEYWIKLVKKLNWNCDDVMAFCWHVLHTDKPEHWTYLDIVKEFRLDYMGLTPDAVKKRIQRVRRKLGI